jgi:hypothetical protein
VQYGPETVVAVGEVVAVFDGAGGVIQPAEDDIETFGQDVRFKLGHARTLVRCMRSKTRQSQQVTATKYFLRP